MGRSYVENMVGSGADGYQAGGAGTASPEANFASTHLSRLATGLSGLDLDRINAWGRQLDGMLRGGGRLLVAGNGGSAAQAQHLSAELIGRYEHDRQAMSALALHCDTSALTAVGNDFGFEQVFARQVWAHGRPGDVLLTLSTSGRSVNLLNAVRAARALGAATWALTGPAPNPVADASDQAIAVAAASTATIQECHLVALHLLCAAVDLGLAEPDQAAPQQSPVTEEPVLAAPRQRRPVSSEPALVPSAAPALQRRRGGLVVVGDCLLDRDLTGIVDRLSPEAPVPVVSDVARSSRPGGAGLAALLVARDGYPVTLVTALAADLAGQELADLLRAAGVSVVRLALPGPTPVKARIRTADRTLLMLDEADRARHSPARLTPQAHEALRTARAVLVSDYGRGMTAVAELRAALAAIVPVTPVVWDPHPLGAEPVAGACLVTPSSREARQFSPGMPGTGLAADIERARALLGRWDVRRVAMTRGAAGAILVDDAVTAPLVVGCEPVKAADSCGAGDRFASAAAIMLAEGAMPQEAVTMAVARAASYVAGGGASSVGTEAPPGYDVAGHGADAVTLARQMRSAGRVVVATGGCFDLLHTGHVRLLEEARRLGDCLIVCLNSDASVARLKGPGRPVVSAADRAAILLALKPVDGVLIFDEDTPSRILAQLQPDFWVKGGDYSIEQLPEAAILPRWGGQVVLVPYVAGRSSTTLIKDAVRGTG